MNYVLFGYTTYINWLKMSKHIQDSLLQMLHTNVTLLEERGHIISFKEGMFQHQNGPGFEQVAYALMRVIDPDEVKKSIPWPLSNNIKLKSDFRLQFVKFIKKINKDNPDDEIPEMAASSLQHPEGEKFVRLIYKLSSFALKLELTRMMGAKSKELLRTPKFKNIPKDDMVLLNINRSVRLQAEQAVSKLLQESETAINTLQQLKKMDKILIEKILTVESKLDIEMSSLPKEFDGIKDRLCDSEDHNVISEWNKKTEDKIKELEERSERICEARDLSAKTCELMKSVESNKLYLDGSQLPVPKLTGCPVTNSQGQIKMDVLLQASASVAHRLATSPHLNSQESLLPRVHTLLEEALQQQATAERCSKAILDLAAESQKMIDTLFPKLYSNIKNDEMPGDIKLLEKRPPLKFAFQQYREEIENNCLKGSKKRLSLGTLIKLQSVKGRKVVCSVRKRRSLGKYTFEQTPRYPNTVDKQSNFRWPTVMKVTSKLLSARTTFVTTACKVSLHGKLPTGSQVQPEKDIYELPNDLSPTTKTGPEESSGKVFDAPSPKKKPRKSIQDLIERYQKIKPPKKSQNEEK